MLYLYQTGIGARVDIALHKICGQLFCGGVTENVSSSLKAPAAHSPQVHSLQETSTDAISRQVPEQLIYFITVREKCRAKFLQGYLVPKSKRAFRVGFERLSIPTDFKWVSLWEIFKPHATSKCIPKVIHKGRHDLEENSALARCP